MARDNFLKSRQAVVVTSLLLALAAVFYGLPKEHPANLRRPLADFPRVLNGWVMVQDNRVDKQVLEVLKADDTLSRFYAAQGKAATANLFIAFFRSQSTGVAPHSPKNCLPGGGWAVSTSDTLLVPVPEMPAPVKVNRYIVSKGDAKSMVLYWYQSHDRVVASEYLAKIYLVWDSICYRRSDTSIVRVTVPVQNIDESAAQQIAADFVRDSFRTINDMLPQ